MTLYIIPKTCGNIQQIIIAFFSSLYYNHICKKNLPFKNFFYITPYLIIYTPLETPGSSPTGCFSVVLKSGCRLSGLSGTVIKIDSLFRPPDPRPGSINRALDFFYTILIFFTIIFGSLN